MGPSKSPWGTTGTFATFLDKYRGRSREAWLRLVDHYAGRVSASVRRHLSNPADVEDAAQEILLALWNAAENYSPERGTFRAWASGITRNCCLQMRSKKGRRDFLEGKSLESLTDDVERVVCDASAALEISEQIEVIMPQLIEICGQRNVHFYVAYHTGEATVQQLAASAKPALSAAAVYAALGNVQEQADRICGSVSG